MSSSRGTSPRLSRLRERLRKERLPALLVTDLSNVRYLTGFTGSSGNLLVSRREAVFVTDFRYRTQAAREVRSCRRVEQRGGLTETLAALVRKKGLRRLGFEGRHLVWQTHRDLGEMLPGVELTAVEGMVERLRMVKERGEIALLRRAVAVAAVAYGTAARRLSGRSEREVAEGLERAMRLRGAEAPAFPPIVAGGRRGALPHASPGKRKIRKGDLVVLDFGARFGGYHSDISRTRLVGPGDRRSRNLYRVVAEAQRQALKAVRPGAAAASVDEAARAVIEKAGYGDSFGHATGHGVGLEVHEGPSVSARSEDLLEKGMVFTVEPGIYVEHFGGVRIEDMVLVTGSGCEILTKSVPKRSL